MLSCMKIGKGCTGWSLLTPNLEEGFRFHKHQVITEWVSNVCGHFWEKVDLQILS